LPRLPVPWAGRSQAWTFGLISLGPLAAAAFHPNPKGLEVMGKAIAAEVGTRLR
jgi:hypothetical protein